MDGPGRKSGASLTVVASIGGERPGAPATLSEAEAITWRAVAATKPADWWSADTFPLLEEYCRAVASSHAVAAALAKFTKIPGGKALGRYLALRKLQDHTARLLATLATKMRLSQQSKYGARAASTAHARTPQIAKPWAFDKGS